MSMLNHINRTCSSAFYYLYNICRIRKHLSHPVTESLVHAFITSRVDYCNSLLYGLPNSQCHETPMDAEYCSSVGHGNNLLSVIKCYYYSSYLALRLSNPWRWCIPVSCTLSLECITFDNSQHKDIDTLRLPLKLIF